MHALITFTSLPLQPGGLETALFSFLRKAECLPKSLDSRSWSLRDTGCLETPGKLSKVGSVA